MKTQRTIAILAIIGSIMAVTGMANQEAHADSEDMMTKMIDVNNRLNELKNNERELPLSKISFEMKQITKKLLEINDINDGNDERDNKIYAHLKENYQIVFENYQKDVKQHQKENGLSITEKKLISQVIKNNQNFENNETKQESKKEMKKQVNEAIKVTNAKEDYQKLVNKIGIKLANEANGGIVEKIHHKVAISEIIDSKKWNLAVPAIDRIIPQTNNVELKEKLDNIKKDIHQMLDKKEKQEKQSQVFELKSNEGPRGLDLIEFKENEIVFSGVLVQIYEDEIISSLSETEEILIEYEESQTLLIESIIEDELTQSLEQVSQIAEEDEEQLEKEKEKQRKESREKKSNGSKSSLGSDNSDKRNENANNNKGKSEGKGNGK